LGISLCSKTFSTFIFILTFLFQTQALAQQAPDGSSGGFTEQITKMMALSNNADAIRIGSEFKTAWEGGAFTEAQKSNIIKLAATMTEKKYKGYPHFSQFYEVLIKGSNFELSVDQMDNLISVALKIEENRSRNDLIHYFSFLNDFLDHKALYYSSYSSLLFDDGKFNFEYIGDETVEEVVDVNETTVEEANPSDDWFNDSDDDWSTSDWDTSSDWGTSTDSEASTVTEESEPVAYTPIIDLPAVTGPVVTFEDVNLYIVTKFDSAQLSNTSGSLMFLKNIFVGEGGGFTWESAGLDPNNVFATFSAYKIKTDKPEFSSENVSLTYADKVDGKIDGVFDYKSSRRDSPDNVRYPRFKSYENNIVVKNLGSENLYYKGGFSLIGNKIFSSSVV